MLRMKKECRKVGCRNLVYKGYCEEHQRKDNRERFNYLDKRKTVESIKFYNSKRWRDTSLKHRSKYPLCYECKKNNRVTVAILVHHDPELNYLLSNGLNPYDDRYLFSLCHNCHQRHLSHKRR